MSYWSSLKVHKPVLRILVVFWVIFRRICFFKEFHLLLFLLLDPLETHFARSLYSFILCVRFNVDWWVFGWRQFEERGWKSGGVYHSNDLTWLHVQYCFRGLRLLTAAAVKAAKPILIRISNSTQKSTQAQAVRKLLLCTCCAEMLDNFDNEQKTDSVLCFLFVLIVLVSPRLLSSTHRCNI